MAKGIKQLYGYPLIDQTARNDIKNNYQKKTDENLQTTDKTIVGSINEVAVQCKEKANKYYVLSNEYSNLNECIDNLNDFYELKLLEKKYSLNKPLNIRKNIKIKGKATISTEDTTFDSVINVQDVDYVEIDDINITTKNIRSTDTIMGIINIKNVKKVILKNIKINGEILLNTDFGLGGINLDNCENVLVDNCEIKNTKNGIRLNKVKKYIIKNNIILSDKIPSFWSTTNTNMFYGIIIDNLIDNTLVDKSVCNLKNNSGNIYNNELYGWDIVISNRFSSNSNIYNNKIFNTCFPITIDRCDKINVYNNTIDLSDANITELHLFMEFVLSSNCCAYSNYIVSKNKLGTGIGSYGNLNSDWKNEPVNNMFFNNNIYNCNHGVNIGANSKNIQVNNNNIKECNSGIVLNVDNINNSNIFGNIIMDNEDYGIVINETYTNDISLVKIENNTILNGKNCGIYGHDNNLGKSIIEFDNNYTNNNTKELGGSLKNTIFKNNVFKAESETSNCIILQDTSGTIDMINNYIYGVITLKAGVTINSYKNIFKGNIWNVSSPTVIELQECAWVQN